MRWWRNMRSGDAVLKNWSGPSGYGYVKHKKPTGAGGGGGGTGNFGLFLLRLSNTGTL